MARKRKSGVNVSEVIREYLKANSTIGPTEAAKAISVQIGKKVTPTYVSNIKALMAGKGKKKGKRGSKPGRKTGVAVVEARATNNGSVELTTIVAMKELVGHVGAKTAHELIDLLA